MPILLSEPPVTALGGAGKAVQIDALAATPRASIPLPIDAEFTSALPPRQRVLAVGCAHAALGPRYERTYPGSVWRDLDGPAALLDGEATPTHDLLVLGNGLPAGHDPAVLFEALARWAAPDADLVLQFEQDATLDALERVIEGDFNSAARHSVASIYKALMDAGWQPTLAGHRTAPAATPGIAAAAMAMADMLNIPRGTAGRGLAMGQVVVRARRVFDAPPAASPAQFTVVVPTTRTRQLRLNVEASPGLEEVGARILTCRNAAHPGEALAAALPACGTDWVLLCHQDVYFPRGFGARLNAALAAIPPDERARTLIGFVGMGVNTKTHRYEPAGFVIDRLDAADHPASDHAVSIDELAIVVARDSLHRIDPVLGWHLWATDLCLTSIGEHRVFPRILRLPLFHNSVTDRGLPEAFHASAAVLARKHASFGPIATLCTTIDATFLETRVARPPTLAGDDAPSPAAAADSTGPAVPPPATVRHGASTLVQSPARASAQASTTLVTLIPAYKIDYLDDLFAGLATQTRRDFRVVLSDDSPGGAIAAALRAGRFDAVTRSLDLTVVQGPRQGSLKNIQHLLAGWGVEAPHVHIHLDDDVLYPDFYREHLRAHDGTGVGASVSLRWVTDSSGRPIAALPLPEFVESHAARSLRLPSEALFASTVPHCANWLGEITNTVLSAHGARHYQQACMAGLSYYGLCDVGTMLSVSRDAPLAFIRDHLSGFRSNPQQSSANPGSFGMRAGHLAWVALALAARRERRLTDEAICHSLATSVERSARLYAEDPSLAAFFELFRRHGRDLDALDAAFESFWHDFLATDIDAAPVSPLPACGVPAVAAATAS